MSDDQPHLAGLFRYPLKGFSGEALERVVLEAGETFPLDRAYAVENGPGRFDPDEPRHLPKINFLMLMRNERLATLQIHLDPDTAILAVYRAGKQVARGDLGTRLGRQMIEQFLAAYMKADLRGAPRIVHAAGHSFSDTIEKCVHIVNLASVRELARMLDRPLDPRRFRANIHVDGLPPFAEQRLVGSTLAIGSARLSVFAPTSRCEATNVDPETATRDLAIPQALERSFGHSDFGVYATVAEGGGIAVGDEVHIMAP
ncbi:MAG: MOSC domain-containing protein [Hyphomicrobiaceae bacterium]